MTTKCDCEHAHADGARSAGTDLGVDPRNGRSGQVTLHRCAACGAPWLHYAVEYEAFSQSSRWFCGRLDEPAVDAVTAENAIATLAGLEWYWAGGGYFDGEVGKSFGPVPVDLYGPPASE